VSDNWIRVIPTDPEWLPDRQQRADALAELSRLVPAAEEIEEIDHGGVQFIDQGGNFERVSCPRCGEVLSRVLPGPGDDDGDWLRATFDGVFDEERGGFGALEVDTPCCGALVSLNDLVWDWPAGFARFELSAMNPGRGWLSADELARIERALGHSVRQILQHI
jgi:hypothetical protein